jgi:hypothetical protein
MTASFAAVPPPLCGKPSHRAGGGTLACPDCLGASVAELLRLGRTTARLERAKREAEVRELRAVPPRR